MEFNSYIVFSYCDDYHVENILEEKKEFLNL